MLDLFLKICVYHLGSYTKACNSRHIVCTGAHSCLLSASKNLGLNPHLVIDVQKSNALWSVDLMAAYGKHIDSQLLRVDPVLAECLDGIYMVKSLRAFLMNKPGNLFHRHHSSHLVVHIHGGNQNSVLAKCLLKSI
ncbi:unknown [Ruminococcus sp. CAG:60]|nr:unknown [Ruminococcus sp. CAG:60]